MPHLHRRLTAAFLALLLLPLPALAQPPQNPEPTLETIMADPDWLGNPPEDPYWADDGRSVYYLHKHNGDEAQDLVRVDLESGQATTVALGDEGKADAPGGDLSLDRRWKTYAREGDVFLKDLQTGTLRQITRTEEDETDPSFLAGDARIAFHRGDQIYVYDLVSGTLSQPADLRLEKDPAEDKESGYLDEQQERLFDVIREGKKKKKDALEHDRDSRRLDPTRAPLPWYLGDDIEIVQSGLSPSADWMVIVTQGKDLPKKPALMARFVTEDGYIKTDDVHSKVGTEPLTDHKILLLDLETHEKHEVDLSKLPGITDDPLKELKEKAEKLKDKDKKNGKDSKDKKKDDKKDEKSDEKKPRPVEAQGLLWTDDGHYGAMLVRSSDNKDRWIVTLDREHPEPVLRHHLTDPAWINWDFNELGWLADNETLWYTSEESGYSSLYALSVKDGKTHRLTEGKLEVSNVTPSRDGKTFYYRANAEQPGVYDIWRIPAAAGGKPEQLTHVGGDTYFQLSPDESKLLLLHSTTTRHGELYVQPAQPTPVEQARQLTQTHSAEYLAIDWSAPEIVPIPSSHVKEPIYARVYTPKDFDPSRKYPAVVFSHGAGYLQNAHAGWSGYFHEFMFHTVLTRHGYVVLDMDYRASAGYGRAWRTAIYRQMGHPELEDLEDGVAWLVKNRGVDPKRVGHYGGSYGGFLTLMAMFTKPDLFAAGAALRPVTDWAHYNHEYTSNILNTPDVDPEAYAKSSPIEFAAGLSKPLLMCSGMVDSNVFFQDTVRLTQRLIELKKENFETAIFPVESHGFVEPTSWLDEYRRIFKLFETNLK